MFQRMILIKLCFKNKGIGEFRYKDVKDSDKRLRKNQTEGQEEFRQKAEMNSDRMLRKFRQRAEKNSDRVGQEEFRHKAERKSGTKTKNETSDFRPKVYLVF